jgi:DNA-binding Xre family transcriptional regulator
MRYSYNKLWKLLIDKNMKKKDLEKAANISSSTMAKMSKELPVNLNVLARICELLEVNIGDILEIIY